MLNFSFKTQKVNTYYSCRVWPFSGKIEPKIVICPKILRFNSHLMQLFAFNYCYFIVLHLSGWIIHTLKCVSKTEPQFTRHTKNFSKSIIVQWTKKTPFGSLFFFFFEFVFFFFSFLTYVLRWCFHPYCMVWSLLSSWISTVVQLILYECSESLSFLLKR